MIFIKTLQEIRICIKLAILETYLTAVANRLNRIDIRNNTLYKILFNLNQYAACFVALNYTHTESESKIYYIIMAIYRYIHTIFICTSGFAATVDAMELDDPNDD